MRIGIVTTWFERGAAYVSRQYRQALVDDHEVLIYARSGERQARGIEAWDGEGVTWAPLDPHPMLAGFDLRHFCRWLDEERLDCVFFNEQRWWEPIVLCNERGITCGAYVDYYTEEMIPLFACYDFLICNTRRHLEAFAWHPQAHYVPWGTDVRLFVPLEQPPERMPTFFHSAGFSPRRKGCDLALTAFAALEVEAKMVIHAQRDLRHELPEQRGLIDELCASGRLEVVEETVPAPGLYARGDVYVYPSRLDGIGLTVAEALASGLPVITCDAPPMNEFVGDTHGALVPVDRLYARSDGYYWPQCDANVRKLSEAMRRYACDRPLLRAHGLAARRYAEQRLDWTRNGSVLPQIIAQCARLSSPAREQAAREARAYDRIAGGVPGRIHRVSPRLFRLARYINKKLLP